MRMLKVYNKEGVHVDSFLKTVKKGCTPDFSYVQRIQFLNSKGLFIRRQFSKSGKTLVRSYR